MCSIHIKFLVDFVSRQCDRIEPGELGDVLNSLQDILVLVEESNGSI